MKKIFLDTNFLLSVYQFRIDIFLEIDRIILEKYELCVLDKTIDELKKLLKNRKAKIRKQLSLL